MLRPTHHANLEAPTWATQSLRAMGESPASAQTQAHDLSLPGKRINQGRPCERVLGRTRHSRHQDHRQEPLSGVGRRPRFDAVSAEFDLTPLHRCGRNPVCFRRTCTGAAEPRERQHPRGVQRTRQVGPVYWQAHVELLQIWSAPQPPQSCLQTQAHWLALGW